MGTKKSISLVLVVLMLFSANVYAGQTRKKKPAPPPKKTEPKPDHYALGVKAAEAKKFDEALVHLNQALAKKPSDAEALNMLAFSQRNLGLIDEALLNYKKALEIRPKFPEAREYLGEAYLKAALREVAILHGYGEEGRAELAELMNAFHSTSEQLKTQGPGSIELKSTW